MKIRNTEKVVSNGKTVDSISATLPTTTSKAKVFTHGLMDHLMMVTGDKIS